MSNTHTHRHTHTHTNSISLQVHRPVLSPVTALCSSQVLLLSLAALPVQQHITRAPPAGQMQYYSRTSMFIWTHLSVLFLHCSHSDIHIVSVKSMCCHWRCDPSWKDSTNTVYVWTTLNFSIFPNGHNTCPSFHNLWNDKVHLPMPTQSLCPACARMWESHQNVSCQSNTLTPPGMSAVFFHDFVQVCEARTDSTCAGKGAGVLMPFEGTVTGAFVWDILDWERKPATGWNPITLMY